MDYKQKFIEYYQANIHREGADRLLEWLQTTDFFTAPASTRYHCACPSGLVQHSVNVYEVMMEKHFDPETDSAESFALCALLHDVCKAQFYKISTRNVKNEKTGQWEKVPYYTIEDAFPYGHGEKSVFLIERFVRLKPAEATAIRWHMGFSGPEDNRTVGQALQKYPLAFALSVADMEASYFLEGDE